MSTLSFTHIHPHLTRFLWSLTIALSLLSASPTYAADETKPVACSPQHHCEVVRELEALKHRIRVLERRISRLDALVAQLRKTALRFVLAGGDCPLGYAKRVEIGFIGKGGSNPTGWGGNNEWASDPQWRWLHPVICEIKGDVR